MRLFSGQNFDEVLIIGDTSSRKEFQQFVIAVSLVDKIYDVSSLWPGDAPSGSELSDKSVIRVDVVK